jgi:iron(III) transport system substrate-binding protein
MWRKWPSSFLIAFLLLSSVSAQSVGESLTIYSARREELVAPIIEQFSEDTGIAVEVRYGNLAEMVAMILEEGENSPADVFFAQDASGLGALAREDRLLPLPESLLERVPAQFRSDDDVWVGISGRARVAIYNTTLVEENDLPPSLLDLADEQWRGMVGWAPTNGPFQGQITAIRVLLGEDTAREWLQDMVANDVVAYPENTALVQGVVDGEVAIGLVNHYYLNEFRAEVPDIPVENHYFEAEDVGALVNVAAAGVLSSTDQPEVALEFIDYMLTESAQTYFATETYEYPLLTTVPTIEGLRPLDTLEPPDVDLSDLDDLEGTIELMQEEGVLP